MVRALVIFFCVTVRPAEGAERLYPFTWTASTLEAGQREPHIQLTERLFRSTEAPWARTDVLAGVGLGLRARMELLIGLQAAVEAWDTNSTRADARLAALWHHSSRGPIGLELSVVGRAALGLDAFELEVRGIVERRFGRVQLTANAAAIRWVLWAGRKEPINTIAEQALAVAFHVNDAFSAGVEGLGREALQTVSYQGSALYLGPTFAIRGQRWWCSVGLVAQVAAHKPVADRLTSEPLEIRHNERFWARIALGRLD